MSSAIFIALRRLRAPIILLILIYAVGIIGMTLVPGRDGDGNPWHMSLFHAFYFISYTATTIGFGEIVHPFTDAQRLWVNAVIYMSVIGWAYAIASVLALLGDRAFLDAVKRQRVQGEVRRLGDPFYILCGFGETGRLICQALDRAKLRVVVVEIDRARAAEVDLHGLSASVPVLPGNAAIPRNLLIAGLRNPSCRGVLAMTGDDSANLAVAITVRLLNPALPVLARSRSRATSANMDAFGTDCVINPFQLFGDYLALLLRAPQVYRLLDRLIGSAASPEIADRPPPRGHWIVCGYGRFGTEVLESFDDAGLDATIIDPDPPEQPKRTLVRGLGTEERDLRAAGIGRSVGIVAGTDDDVTNLSIAVMARRIKREIYVIVRQNRTSNGPLFEAFGADFTVVARALVAEYCIALVRTPLLGRMISRVEQTQAGFGEAALAAIEQRIGPKRITAWEARVGSPEAAAFDAAWSRGPITLDALLRDARERERPLEAVPLLMLRGGEETFMPAAQMRLQRGDRILFAGTDAARESQLLALTDRHALDYIVNGTDHRSGWVWQRLAKAWNGED